MVQELFKVPVLGVPVTAYGFLIMSGFLAAVWVGTRNARAEGIDRDFLIDFSIFLMLAGFLSAKITYMLQMPQEYHRPWEPFDITDGRWHPLGLALGVLPLVAAWGYRHPDERWRKGLWAAFGATVAAAILTGAMTWSAQRAAETQHGADPDLVWKRAPWALGLGAVVLCILTGLAAASGSRAKPWSWRSRHGVALVAAVLASMYAGVRAAGLVGHMEEVSWDFFTRWRAGFVLYGGLLGAFAAGWIYVWWFRIPSRPLMDVAAGPMLLGIAFGRIGCFLNGCCYGKTDPGWVCAVPYPPGSTPFVEQVRAGLINENAPQSLPVHPTQLYEVVAMAALFFVVQAVFRRRRWKGQAFAVAAGGYALWRFLVEFLRGDRRPYWMGISFSQWVSIAVFAVVLVWWLVARRRSAAQIA
jgi:phosphatidylglycerol:prolipoprotein diacylglycerol transferase